MNDSRNSGVVTAVVASYNHAEYLKQRMDSLVAQTYPKTEILVIEDCSPDHSLEVLREYEKNPRVTLVIRAKNGGWVTVSNQGIDLAQGEFVLFANCDDACDPRMIDRLVSALRAHPSAGIAFCRSLFVDEQDREIGDDFGTRERSFRELCANDALISSKQMNRFLLHSCAIPNLSAALIRKQCFSDAGRFSADYRVCSDWDLFFRIAAKWDVAYVAEPLNRFRQHETTIRSVTKERVISEEMFRLLLGQIRRLDLSFAERSRYRTRVMYLWAVHLLSPSWSGLRNFPYHLKRVLQLDPAALAFLAPGLLQRAGEIAAKLLGIRSRVSSASA